MVSRLIKGRGGKALSPEERTVTKDSAFSPGLPAVCGSNRQGSVQHSLAWSLWSAHVTKAVSLFLIQGLADHPDRSIYRHRTRGSPSLKIQASNPSVWTAPFPHLLWRMYKRWLGKIVVFQTFSVKWFCIWFKILGSQRLPCGSRGGKSVSLSPNWFFNDLTGSPRHGSHTSTTVLTHVVVCVIFRGSMSTVTPSSCFRCFPEPIRNQQVRNFPGGPVVRNLLADSGDTGSTPSYFSPWKTRSYFRVYSSNYEYKCMLETKIGSSRVYFLLSCVFSSFNRYVFRDYVLDPTPGNHRLHLWAFSSCGEQGLLSSCGVQAPQCSGFSCDQEI